MALLLTAGFGLGPILLNARDGRRAMLLATAWALVPRDLRGMIAIEVRCPLLWGANVVEVDMCDCGREQIWEAVTRWQAGLPPRARLLVTGSLDDRVPTEFTLETACRSALP